MATTLLDSDMLMNKRIKVIPAIKTTTMSKVPEAQVGNIDASCTYCRNIFLGDVEVYQCNTCGVFYHEPCLIKMKEKIQGCRYCGSKI